MFLIVKKKLSRGGIKISLIQREKERERIRGALFLPWIPSLKENVFSIFGWKRCTESQLFRRREKVAPVASGFLALGELRHFPSRAAKKVPFRLKTKPFNRFHRFSKYCEIRKKGTSQRFILPFLLFSRSPFVPPPIHVYRRVKGIHFSSSRTGEKKNPLLSNWIIFHRFFGKFIYFPAKPDQNRTLSVYPSPIPHRHPRTTPPSSPTRLASTIFNTPTMI